MMIEVRGKTEEIEHLYTLKENLIENLEKLHKLSKREHHQCEDSWYSCPKSEDGCANEQAGDDCNCGAEKADIEADRLFSIIMDSIQKNNFVL